MADSYKHDDEPRPGEKLRWEDSPKDWYKSGDVAYAMWLVRHKRPGELGLRPLTLSDRLRELNRRNAEFWARRV